MNAIIDHKLDETGAYRPRSLMRDPMILMQPERLAAMQPTRVSASRALVARAAKQRWTIRKKIFEADEQGAGRMVYRIDADGYILSFVAHSFVPESKGRTGRIIGTAWDMMGSLIEGDVNERDIELIAQEMPLLYHGRAAPRTLIWCRSNRSGRVFDDTIAALAQGRQPDMGSLAKANYIMRNTGLDGNGTFGTRSFLALEDNHPLRTSLSAQMLTAYLMRVFALDLANHLAFKRGGSRAVELDERIARYLGVGNGSALGLMYYVNNHPRLIDRWIRGQEEALAHAKLSHLTQGDGKLDLVLELLDRAITYRHQDQNHYEVFTPSTTIASDLRGIRKEFAELRGRLYAGALGPLPLVHFAEGLEGRYCADAIETFNSALIELVPELADAIAANFVVDEELVGRPEMSVARLREIVRADYGWVFRLDLESEKSQRYVWYKSANAEEPRRGARSEVPEDAYNLAFDLPRLVVHLEKELNGVDPKSSIARFLVTRPELRRIVTRVQALQGLPYHSPHADIMHEDFVPAHITRLLNGPIHGLDRTEDAMARVLRGVLMHGAPLAYELADGSAQSHWFHPAVPTL
ncbi:hypothetical protein QBK99_05390 [Corticibacterium sp. UT-5YL-CI-8]|nr:hypothetical protein [Tianweitania sp. UT-5YL-CI-8]